MKKVDFIFFDAGGGHRSAANALKSVVEEQGRQWQVRLFNLQEELDSLDIFKKITGSASRIFTIICSRKDGRWALSIYYRRCTESFVYSIVDK